jgi:hypothetical protein
LLCLKANDEDADEEFLLNWEEPQKNNGMLVYLCDVVVGNEMVESVTILKPIFDMRDAKNKNITATLLGDGSGIRVSEPTVPSCLLDGPHGDCRLSKIAHAVVAKSIKKKEAGLARTRQFKTVILRFPDGKTCNSKHFNKKGTHFLNNNIEVKGLDIKGKDPKKILMESKVAFMTWKVAVDGTTRDFNDSDDEDGDDEEWTTALSKHKKDQANKGETMDVDHDEQAEQANDDAWNVTES